MNENNVERVAGNVVYLIFLVGSAVGLYFIWGWIGGGWGLLWKIVLLYFAVGLFTGSLKGLVKGR